MNDEALFDDALAARRAIPRARDMPPPSIRSDADAEFALGCIAASLRNPAPLVQRPAGPPAADAQRLREMLDAELRPLIAAAGHNVERQP